MPSLRSAARAHRSALAPSPEPVPAAPLRRTGPSCPACGSDRLTRIGMTLTDGSPVDFASCHDCEHKTWTQHGRPLPFPSVLDKARKPR